jgi:ankyrin repeat domain-containing protein 50
MAESLLHGKRFYCREWAFMKLSHCLEQRHASKAGGALILGGAGCGKTALCSELVWPSMGTGQGGYRQRSLHRRLLAYHFCQVRVTCYLFITIHAYYN